MPWNNQSGGGGSGGGNNPWGKGGGGGGPWGQGPSGGGGGSGGGQKPDLEDLIKRSQERFKQMGGGSGLPGPLAFILGGLLLAFATFYAFSYRVNPDELGVVMRFGEFVRQQPPGLHFRLPYPIEEVRLPKVTRQNTIDIGFRSAASTRRGGPAGTDIPEESLMLTGDENIVDVDFVVYWRIRTDKDPKSGKPGVEQYLFNIHNPDLTVKEVAESAMREIVGQLAIQRILTEGRQKIEEDVRKLMQEVLDNYGSGIRIDSITLQKVDPPAQVIDSFRDVQAARADKERLQNEATTYANRIVPEARGEAERILQGAEGYKQQTVAEATGQAARFLKVFEEYKKAPEVTRNRMFYETMERVMGGTDKIIIDGKGGQGVVPFLPLDQLHTRKKEGAN
jgi:modulator of FtsH protease HflK